MGQAWEHDYDFCPSLVDQEAATQPCLPSRDTVEGFILGLYSSYWTQCPRSHPTAPLSSLSVLHTPPLSIVTIRAPIAGIPSNLSEVRETF